VLSHLTLPAVHCALIAGLLRQAVLALMRSARPPLSSLPQPNPLTAA